ncbi:MAG: hypothetical protein P4N60_06515 [Verrucomicrobiae bacterium]|nr:hypothetical protein [Verrucomicrobiae bacterium]
MLELDLVAYSDIARVLEENLDVQAVRTFQDQIQSFVDEALNRLQIQRNDVVFGTAGDNALLIFDDAATMHHFAKTVQELVVSHNRQKSVDSAKRWFRMGAATGLVLVIPEERRIVGTTVARAVRLEAAAEKGELLVDYETFEALPDQLKAFYNAGEHVAGKRDEIFACRRCNFVPAAAKEELQKPPALTAPKAAAPGKSNIGKALVIVCVIAVLTLLVIAALFKFIPTNNLPGSLALVVSICIPILFYSIFRLFFKTVKELNSILALFLVVAFSFSVMVVGLFGRQIKDVFHRNTSTLGGTDAGGTGAGQIAVGSTNSNSTAANTENMSSFDSKKNSP